MKVSVIVGTRPEIIKMAPIIKELEKRGADFLIIHTGQHYSYNMDEVFFKQLKLPQANFKLEVGSGSHAEQTAKVLTRIEKILKHEKPGIVLVEGDTNSVLASALAASKLHIKVGHVEAGLRSGDKQMPEEINRILTDHCSDYLFAPTEISKINLMSESINEEMIFVTGNTIVDALMQNLEIAKHEANVLQQLNLNPKNYCLVTLHRQENVDSRERFTSILEGLSKVGLEIDVPVVYPIHPRARKMMAGFNLNPANLKIIEPQDYFSFIQLESNARLILTDSGGIQEEACILRVPCVTLRDNTERPETIGVGANLLAGSTATKIVNCSYKMMNKATDWFNPFGDGKAAEIIIDIVEGNE
ncbi:non-hydrolyzing UDP-N-acetylglucosamine 2-epimerase [Chloroflexota bacterium]